MRSSPALRIVAFYAVVAAVWIVFSDKVVEAISPSAEDITYIQTYKGLIYVMCTSLLLFFLLRQAFQQRQNVEDQLRDFNNTLEKRIEDRTKALETANHNLRELEQSKTQFIADVSHELRNPMTNLHMIIHLLKKAPPEKHDDYILRLENGINNLGSLMRDVLDLSKLDSKAYQVDFKQVDLNVLVRQVADSLQTPAHAKKLTLIFEPCAERTVVWGAEEQLKQVVMNLLTNAIHYTNEGMVRARTEYHVSDQQIILAVTDTGVGIREEDLPHIFDRFYRGHQTTIQQVSGSGLGLSIIQGIVERHKGSIDVKSQVNVGSTFTVALPTNAIFNEDSIAS